VVEVVWVPPVLTTCPGAAAVPVDVVDADVVVAVGLDVALVEVPLGAVDVELPCADDESDDTLAGLDGPLDDPLDDCDDELPSARAIPAPP